MIFSNDEWPGGTNLAATPAAWDEMFAIVDSPSFGSTSTRRTSSG